MDDVIKQDESKKCFEVMIDGYTAELKYRRKEDLVYEFYHTGVPKELEGKGIGSALVRYALEHARKNNWKINPTCPFVKTYIVRHPEYQDLEK